MEYFKIMSDKAYSNGPKIKDWYGRINTKQICYGYAHTFPERMLFFVEDNAKLIFTQYVAYPFVLVNDEARKVISRYDKNVPFKKVVLLEYKHKKMQVYNLPFLHHFMLIEKKTIEDKVCYYLDVREKELRQKRIFQFMEYDKTITIMKLDMVESLLRRKVTGFTIEPVVIRGLADE